MLRNVMYFKALLLLAFAPCCFASSEPKEIVELGGKKYYFSQKDLKAGFIAAARTCSDVNMSLLSLETLEEAALIREYLLANDPDFAYWTSGIHFNGNWLWTGSGELFSEVDWYPYQPDNFNQNFDLCTYLLRNGTLWDNNCDNKYSFICEEKTC